MDTGSGCVLERLRSALDSDRLAHAYLLVAPPSSGLEIAYSIGSLVLCEKRSACGVCQACKLCSARGHPDVLVAAPTGRSEALTISQIRDVIDFVAKKPYLGTAKIVILVEADRMTREAANAFLKTLEEPAGNSILLLVSARPQALPETVVSRCQPLDWNQDQPSNDVPALETRLQELLVTAAQSRDPLRIASAVEELLQAARSFGLPEDDAGAGSRDAERAVVRRNVLALLSKTVRQASPRGQGNAPGDISLRSEWLYWMARLERLERLLDRHMDERLSMEDVLLFP